MAGASPSVKWVEGKKTQWTGHQSVAETHSRTLGHTYSMYERFGVNNAPGLDSVFVWVCSTYNEIHVCTVSSVPAVSYVF